MKERIAKLFVFLLPALVVFTVEITVFNVPFWESLFFPDEEIVKIDELNGLQREKNLYTITDASNPYIQIEINGKKIIDNIKLDIHCQTELCTGRAGKTFTIYPYVLDEGNTTTYINLGKSHVSEGLEATHYVRIHPAGEVSSLRLKIDGSEGETIGLNNISINATVPFYFSLLRVIAMLLVAYVAFFFWPSRSMYKWRLSLSERRQIIIVACFMLIQSVLLLLITQLIVPERIFSSTNVTNDGAFINDDNQYNHLADAIIAGKPYLDLPVPDWLAAMDNPYDAQQRALLSQATGEPTYWDYAFYNGRYYTYFGVLPALLTFIPYKLLTGQDLRTDYSVAAFSLLFVGCAVFFMYQFFTSFLKRANFGIFLISCLLFINASSVLTQNFFPKIYSLPILASLSFSLLGLGLWLLARKQETLKKWMLICGSLCIAFNLGCRPQFVLVALFAFPIFWHDIKEGLFFSRRGMCNTACVILPFIFVGIAAMYYNYIRFDSFFDFGATYNLTGFDMVHRSYALARIPLGIWMYLFQPLNITPNFPFMRQIDNPEMFTGQTIMEPYFGGFFAFAPAALFVLAFGCAYKEMKNIGLFGLNMVMSSFAILIIAVDTEVASITSRYFGDFAWLLLIVAISIAVLLVQKYSDERLGRVILVCFVMLTLFGTFIGYFNLIADGRYGMLSETNNTLYRIIESWFLFLH